MEYIVSARKYRPMTFDSVVGQSSLTTTLKNAVSSGKLAHAYLFCGPRGVGKTTCARIFAKVINCLNPTANGDACGECESCKAFDEGRSLNIFELDAASNNGVEHIKALMEQTRIPPQTGKYKVFIVDEVHMLSTAAFNAFLKTLEEPPKHVIFILATTEKHKILPTIISRCQIYDFDRMSVQGIISHLKHVAEKEGYTYEEEALNVIAEKADGGMRDALSIFDQAASYCQGNITLQKVLEDLNVLDAENYFKIISLSLENKASDLMLLVNDILSRGFDGGHLVNGLASHVRNVMMAADPQTVKLIETSDTQRQHYAEQAKKCPVKFLYGALKLLNQCDLSYRLSSNKRLLVELTLIQLAQLTQEDATAPDASGRRPCKSLKSLFQQLLGGAQSSAAAQVAQTANAQSQAPQTTPQTTPSSVQSPMASPSGSPSSPVQATKASPSGSPSRPAVKLGSIGTTFSRIMNPQTAKSTDRFSQGGTSVAGNKTFTDDDMSREWLTLCNRMLSDPALNALGQRMRNAKLRITEFPKVECIVGNAYLYEDVKAKLPFIQSELATSLSNGGLTITLTIVETDEGVHRLTPREFVEKLTAQNNDFAMLCKELDLVIE